MKFAAAVLSVLMFTNVASAQSALSKADTASMLVKALSKAKAGTTEHDLLSGILSGQSYEQRISITESQCNFVGRSLIVECAITVGTDDMNDDDSGWGTLYRLDIRGLHDNDTVESVTASVIAG